MSARKDASLKDRLKTTWTFVLEVPGRMAGMVLGTMGWYAQGARRFTNNLDPKLRHRRHASDAEREKTAALTKTSALVRTMPVPTGKRAIDLGSSRPRWARFFT